MAAVTHLPTEPLPAPAAEALLRLELAFSPVVAEQRRVERIVSALRVGESAVVNGTPVTVVSLAVAEAVTVYETAAMRAAQLAAKAATGVDLPALDVRAWEFAEELMTGARATLAAAGMLHLVAADDHGKTKEPLPKRPRGPHPYRTAGAAR